VKASKAAVITKTQCQLKAVIEMITVRHDKLKDYNTTDTQMQQ